jgi:stage II sporulation protein D
MRRWTKPALASLLAAGGVAACHRPAAVAPAPTAGEPELGVGIVVGAARVLLGGEGGGELFITDDGNGQPIGSIPSGATWTLLPDSGTSPPRLRLVKTDGTITEPHPGIAAVNVTEDRFAIANGRRYRGRLHVIAGPRGLTVVNRVGVEGYLAGVIAPEIGARRPDEMAAVLAQAVVSRTFALGNRGRWESLGFDAYADTRDQVYVGVGAETAQAWDAVRRTAGQVLRYRGEIIDAFFHSTCGFSTAGVEEAFGTASARPYLQPVSDASRSGHYYCDLSPRFRWREEWDGAKLRAILSRTLPAVAPATGGGGGLQRIIDVEVSRKTRSGRVGELRVVFDRGDARVPGPDVRNVLRPTSDRSLPSTAFQLTVTKEGGEVSRVVAAGAGSGHGVGMCQWGAVGRARAGQDYRKILTTYFPGTTLERLY